MVERVIIVVCICGAVYLIFGAILAFIVAAANDERLSTKFMFTWLPHMVKAKLIKKH